MLTSGLELHNILPLQFLICFYLTKVIRLSTFKATLNKFKGGVKSVMADCIYLLAPPLGILMIL